MPCFWSCSSLCGVGHRFCFGTALLRYLADSPLDLLLRLERARVVQERSPPAHALAQEHIFCALDFFVFW